MMLEPANPYGSLLSGFFYRIFSLPQRIYNLFRMTIRDLREDNVLLPPGIGLNISRTRNRGVREAFHRNRVHPAPWGVSLTAKAHRVSFPMFPDGTGIAPGMHLNGTGIAPEMHR